VPPQWAFCAPGGAGRPAKTLGDPVVRQSRVAGPKAEVPGKAAHGPPEPRAAEAPLHNTSVMPGAIVGTAVAARIR
jgi:hypothetical protein